MNELESLRRLTEAVKQPRLTLPPLTSNTYTWRSPLQPIAAKRDATFSTACAEFPPNTNANTPNGYSPTHSLPIMGICIWARCSISPKRQELPSAKRRLQTAGQVQKGTAGTAQKLSAHTCARNKVYNSESPDGLRNCCRVANPNSRYPPFRQPTGRNSCNVL